MAYQTKKVWHADNKSHCQGWGMLIVTDTITMPKIKKSIKKKLQNLKLNFIEQCWGYAKQIYCLDPESS